MALLTLEMEQNHVTVSVVTSLQVCVSCKEETVSFSPKINPDTGLFDGIYLTFLEGEGEEELQKDIQNISISIADRPDWDCGLQKKEEVLIFGKTPVWRLRPRGGGSVKEGEKFTIHVDNIHSNDVTGITKMRIYQQTTTEIERDSSLEIIKCSLAKINVFEITEKDYNIGDLVSFHWEIDDTDKYSKIYFEQMNDKEAQGSIEYEVHNGRTYHLLVCNGSSYKVIQPLQPVFTFFEGFWVEDGNGKDNTLTLAWKTRNLDSCQLVYGEQIYDVSVDGGSMKIPLEENEEESAKFVLKMTEKETQKQLPDEECTYVFPKVTLFKAYRESDFIDLHQLEQMELKRKIQPPYAYTPDPPEPEPQQLFPVHIEWDSENADHCSLKGVPAVRAVQGSIVVDLPGIPKDYLYAVDKYGFQRGKKNEV